MGITVTGERWEVAQGYEAYYRTNPKFGSLQSNEVRCQEGVGKALPSETSPGPNSEDGVDEGGQRGSLGEDQ